MCSIYMVSKPRRTRHLSSSDLQLDHFFLAICSIPTLHQKQKVYHLIPQVKELLIKLDCSIMMVVMKTWNVQVADPNLYVWLCDRLSSLPTAFATGSPFFSLHSLQQLSPSYCIQNGSYNRASHSLQLSPVEGRHGGNAPHQRALLDSQKKQRKSQIQIKTKLSTWTGLMKLLDTCSSQSLKIFGSTS